MTDKERQDQENWIIRQTKFDASEADFYDSIFFQGNGYVGVGAFRMNTILVKITSGRPS